MGFVISSAVQPMQFVWICLHTWLEYSAIPPPFSRFIWNKQTDHNVPTSFEFDRTLGYAATAHWRRQLTLEESLVSPWTRKVSTLTANEWFLWLRKDSFTRNEQRSSFLWKHGRIGFCSRMKLQREQKNSSCMEIKIGSASRCSSMVKYLGRNKIFWRPK